MKPKILAALLATLALSAIAASAATAALPEFKISNGFPQKFTNSSGETWLQFAKEGDEIRCAKTKITGEIKNSKEVANVVVTVSEYEGPDCRTTLGVMPGCETIKSKTLKGHIAYINKSKKEVGLVLEGEGGGEEPVWAEFNCDGFTNVLKGHLISKIGPVNKPGQSEIKVYWENTKGVEIPNQVEGGPAGQQLRLSDPVLDFENELIGLARGHASENPLLLKFTSTATYELVA